MVLQVVQEEEVVVELLEQLTQEEEVVEVQGLQEQVEKELLY